jgi:hypothetical protein
VADGCAVGVWVAFGVGVPACAGARTDRIPGIEACAPDSSEPDGWVVDGWVADGCAVGAWVALGVGVPACAGSRTDRMPGIEACGPEG